MIKKEEITVGTIVIARLGCMGNPVGARAVCFEVYDGGFQFIYPNGEYCGFGYDGSRDEVNAFFGEIFGYVPSIGGYQFTNVMQLTKDYRAGRFNGAFK